MASRLVMTTPRPVASLRPFDPPITTGFPVTTAVSVCWACMEKVSINHAMVISPVLTSGAGMSFSGPKMSIKEAV